MGGNPKNRVFRSTGDRFWKMLCWIWHQRKESISGKFGRAPVVAGQPQICGNGCRIAANRRVMWKRKKLKAALEERAADLRGLLRLREEGSGRLDIYRREKLRVPTLSLG